MPCSRDPSTANEHPHETALHNSRPEVGQVRRHLEKEGPKRWADVGQLENKAGLWLNSECWNPMLTLVSNLNDFEGRPMCFSNRGIRLREIRKYGSKTEFLSLPLPFSSSSPVWYISPTTLLPGVLEFSYVTPSQQTTSCWVTIYPICSGKFYFVPPFEVKILRASSFTLSSVQLWMINDKGTPYLRVTTFVVDFEL